jgi:hypothetical protein
MSLIRAVTRSQWSASRNLVFAGKNRLMIALKLPRASTPDLRETQASVGLT